MTIFKVSFSAFERHMTQHRKVESKRDIENFTKREILDLQTVSSHRYAQYIAYWSLKVPSKNTVKLLWSFLIILYTTLWIQHFECSVSGRYLWNVSLPPAVGPCDFLVNSIWWLQLRELTCNSLLFGVDIAPFSCSTWSRNHAIFLKSSKNQIQIFCF